VRGELWTVYVPEVRVPKCKGDVHEIRRTAHTSTESYIFADGRVHGGKRRKKGLLLDSVWQQFRDLMEVPA
jgi:hypothetical protein